MKRIYSTIIATVLAIATIMTSGTVVFAASSEASTGSQGSDIAVLDDSNYNVAGKDTKQNQKSEYEYYTLNGDDIISSVNVYATIVDGADVYDPENPDAGDDGFVNGDIMVGVPTTIILSGTPDANGYYVGEASGKVKGNISGGTIINVVPDAEVTLSAEGKTNVTAPVEQDYTQFVVSTSEFGGTMVNKHVTPNFNDKAVFDVSVKTKDLSAGSWAGSFNYNISVTNTETSPLGNRIRSWEVSETGDDDVWMTYYQPEGLSATSAQIENADGTTTNVDKYENGTVVIRGTGKMESSVNRLFYDVDAMNVYANSKYWANIHEYITDEEYNTLTAEVSEGTRLFEYYSSSSINTTDEFEALELNVKKIARNVHFGLDPNEIKNFRIYIPKAIIIEDGVTNVSNSAFSWCEEVTSVIIPESVTEIESAAFSNCRKLATISNLSNVTAYGSFSFNGCVMLTDITLGSGVTSVGQLAFDNMTATIHCPTQAIADKVVNANNGSNSAKPTVVVE